ncbi:MAG: hypothetical protein QNJ07_00790 [Woeseiaceae bacterium]|nr:hypothetical protein [Woeseiaceae bacterium]
MNKSVIALVSGGLLALAGTVGADSHEEGGMDPATPVEAFGCTLNDGKTMDDWNAVASQWNKWADKQDLTDYSAWTLTPHYYGVDRAFDVIWLGGSPSGAALGRAQDSWIATGSKVAEAFAGVSTCSMHSAFAVLQFKQPPERESPDNIVISFADCKLSDGSSFGDIGPSLGEWGKWRESTGSTSGIWVFFPAYGGGGEDYDFKYVAAWQNLEDMGEDFDMYSKEGWAKAEELFAGKVSCDSSRAYLAANVRRAESKKEE